MKKYQLSPNFYLHEFVPKSLYMRWKAKSIYWVEMNGVLRAQLMRDLTGESVTICNWFYGGVYNESGFRMPNTKTGGFLSQHKLANARDWKVGQMTSHEMHEVIYSNWEQFRSLGMTTLEHASDTESKHGELGRDWTHEDSRSVNGIWDLDKGPYIVRP